MTDASEISDPDTLNGLYGAPSRLAADKCIDHLDKHARRFISLSPFLCLATADGAGRLDVSPRGDAPGFVQVVDDKRLLIPDRRGNNRVDSLGNVVENPRVGAQAVPVPGERSVPRPGPGARPLVPDRRCRAGRPGELQRAGALPPGPTGNEP